MGGKELWIKEEERVEEVMVELLYECVSLYGEDSYGVFLNFIDQFIKDGKTIEIDKWKYIERYDLTSDQFDNDWYTERAEFLVDEHQAEMTSKYAEYS